MATMAKPAYLFCTGCVGLIAHEGSFNTIISRDVAFISMSVRVTRANALRDASPPSKYEMGRGRLTANYDLDLTTSWRLMISTWARWRNGWFVFNSSAVLASQETSTDELRADRGDHRA
jgi:hypothetical protein